MRRKKRWPISGISICSTPLLLGLDDFIAGPSERRWGRLVGLPYSVEVLPGVVGGVAGDSREGTCNNNSATRRRLPITVGSVGIRRWRLATTRGSPSIGRPPVRFVKTQAAMWPTSKQCPFNCQRYWRAPEHVDATRRRVAIKTARPCLGSLRSPRTLVALKQRLIGSYGRALLPR